MKKYRIVFTPTAQLHALRFAEFIAADSLANAFRWYENLIKAIESLEFMPGRCGPRERMNISPEI